MLAELAADSDAGLAGVCVKATPLAVRLAIKDAMIASNLKFMFLSPFQNLSRLQICNIAYGYVTTGKET